MTFQTRRGFVIRERSGDTKRRVRKEVGVDQDERREKGSRFVHGIGLYTGRRQVGGSHFPRGPKQDQ